MAEYPKLRDVRCQICEACIAGDGQECHTPGCIMWLHRVDIPFVREAFDFLDEQPERRSDLRADASA